MEYRFSIVDKCKLVHLRLFSFTNQALGSLNTSAVFQEKCQPLTSFGSTFKVAGWLEKPLWFSSCSIKQTENSPAWKLNYVGLWTYPNANGCVVGEYLINNPVILASLIIWILWPI